MSEPEHIERDPAGAEAYPDSRFPINRGGWIGIGALVLALVYFVLPHETADRGVAPRPLPPESTVVAPQALRNQYEVIVSSAPSAEPADETAAGAKQGTPSAKPEPTPAESRRAEQAGPAERTPAAETRPPETPPASRESHTAEVTPREPRATETASASRELRGSSAVRDPPTLYIHVRDETQRKWAERMVVPLAQKGIHVAGIRVVGSGPSTRDLRYFGADEQAGAAEVAQALREVGVATEHVRRLDPPAGRPKPKHYELWLPPGRAEARPEPPS
ncbi:MAG: hypothetical protein ACXWUH_13595 [Burkholderiales bacterium]